MEWQKQKVLESVQKGEKIGDIIKLSSVSVKDKEGNYRDKFKLNEKIYIESDFNVLKKNNQVCCVFGFTYYSNKSMVQSGQFYSFDDYVKKEWGKQEDFDIGRYRSVLEIPENLLNEGLYSLIIDIFLH